MKGSLKLLGSALVAVMALGVGRGLFAEEGEGHKHEGQGGRMMKKLGLSEDESKKLKELRAKHQEAMKPLREKRRELMGTLRGQVKAKAADSEISGTLGSLEANHKSVEAEQNRHMAEIKASFKPTQQAKMLLAMKSMMGKNTQRRMNDRKKDHDDHDDDEGDDDHEKHHKK